MVRPGTSVKRSVVTEPSAVVTPPPRGSSAAVRRALEDAAADLIARKGYAGTTVDDIVAAAGVSKPALYRHFASKKDLHLALLERHRDELAAAALAGLFPDDPEAPTPRAARPDAAAQIASMIDAWFAYVEDHPFVWLMFRDTTGDPEVLALHRELQARQRAADVALLREFAPGIPEAELEPLGELIRSSLYGLALHWSDHPDLERSVLVDTMTRMLRGLVLTTT